MRKNTFHSIPTDLQNLIVEFCWSITAQRFLSNLKTCTEIKNWKLHPMFLKLNVWCVHKRRYVANPLRVFRPIMWFGNIWRYVFNWECVEEVLYRLDFRKNGVREMGTREQWSKRLRNWRNILYFDGFFTLMALLPNPFKPTFRTQRFEGCSFERSLRGVRVWS